MRRYIVCMACICVLAIPLVFAAELTESEQQLKEGDFYFEAQKLNISSYAEYSWVKQNGRKGDWKQVTNTISYALNDMFVPYVEVNLWQRFGVSDQTIAAGTYMTFKDGSSWHGEVGFGGSHIDYIYRSQATLEYEHKLLKALYWNCGLRYLNYADNDVYIFSPGVRYYFGNHSVSVFYNTSSTEGRGVAQWGAIRGDFALLERLHLAVGTAIGERLYDITDRKASEQYGYIFFSNLDFNVSKNLKLRLGVSYSKEEPAFIKRSLDFGATVAF